MWRGMGFFPRAAIRPPRRRAAFGLALVVALGLLAAPARACDPELLERTLEDAEAQLDLAIGAETLFGAQVHLRRAALVLAEAEAQFIGCGCTAAQFEVAAAVAEARRAAFAQAAEEFAASVDAAVEAMNLTRAGLAADMCY